MHRFLAACLTACLAVVSSRAEAAYYPGPFQVLPAYSSTNAATTWVTGTSVNAAYLILTPPITSGGANGAQSCGTVNCAGLGPPFAVINLEANGGTFTAGAATIKVSYDGTNFVTPQAWQVVTPAATGWSTLSIPYTFVASTNETVGIYTNGAQAVEVVLSTAITGSSSPSVAIYSTLAPIPPVTLVSGLGTAGSPAPGVETIQGIASMTPVQVSPTTSVNAVGNPFYVAPGTSANFAGAAPMQSTGGTVQTVAGTTGGDTMFTALSAATTNSTNVKSSAGTLYHYSIYNNSASKEYVEFFNSGSAPTCTGTPVWVAEVPPLANGLGVVEDFGGLGLAFSTGIGFCMTTAYATSGGGTGSVALGDINLNIGYK